MYFLKGIEDYNKKIVDCIEKNVSKTMIYFYISIIIRMVVPVFLFRKIPPLYAILINEIILDHFISAHHYIKYTMPYDKRYLASHYYTDKPLDHYGFFMALQPVLKKENKFYDTFKGYRKFMLNLFLYRLLGLIVYLITNNRQIFILFPNFYLTSYVIISFYHQFNIPKNNLNYVLFLGFIFSILKEINIHGNNATW